jgi:threonyl-tRNA synthetase
MLIIGEKEMQEGMVSVRKHGEGDKGSMTLEEFQNHLQQEIII